MKIEKNYTGPTINEFWKLKRLLEEWYNLFYCNIHLNNGKLTDIDLQSISEFDYSVDWDFVCSNNKLTSLKWCPISISGDFSCYSNNLISLEWCPEDVWMSFDCSVNKLISLEKWPEIVSWDFICYDNKIVSLEGLPNHIGADAIWFPNQLNQLKIIRKWIFKLWNNIYYWNPDIDLTPLVEFTKDSHQKLIREYVKTFNLFIKSTTLLPSNSLSNDFISINWKKFKNKLLNKIK